MAGGSLKKAISWPSLHTGISVLPIKMEIKISCGACRHWPKEGHVPLALLFLSSPWSWDWDPKEREGRAQPQVQIS